MHGERWEDAQAARRTLDRDAGVFDLSTACLTASATIQRYACVRLLGGSNRLLTPRWEPSARLPSYPDTGAEEDTTPVLLLWAVPAMVVIGCGIYFIGNMH